MQRQSTTYIITTTQGARVVCKTSNAAVSIPDSMAKEMGLDDNPGADNKPLCILLAEKLLIPGLSEKITNFIKSEIQSLQENPIGNDPYYILLLEKIGTPKSASIEEFLIEQLKTIRISQQKGNDKVLNEYANQPGVASVVVERNSTGKRFAP